MAIVFLNNFSTVTASPLAPADTTLEPQDGIADIAAALTGGNTLVLTLFTADDQGNETQREIIHATAADEVAGTLTIERAKEGTTAGTWTPNTGVEQRLTAGVLSTLVANEATEPTSFLIGEGVYATAPRCLVIGHSAYSTDNDNVVIGNSAYSTDNDSVVIGNSAYSTDNDSVVIGQSAYSTDNDNVVIGQIAYSARNDSVVIGGNCNSEGRRSVVIGNDTRAEGDDSVAIGQGASNSGDESIALGGGAVANGKRSIAIGEGVEANANGGIRFGALSYLPSDVSNVFGPPSEAAMASVVASGTLNTSKDSTMTVKAPDGMLLMPDAIEFLVTNIPVVYSESAISPEGITAANTGGFICVNKAETLMLYSDGSYGFLLNLPDLTLVAGAPSDLSNIAGADFNEDGSFLAVARSEGQSVTVYDTSDWTEVVGGPTGREIPALRVKFAGAGFGAFLGVLYESGNDTLAVALSTTTWDEGGSSTILGTAGSIGAVPGGFNFLVATSREAGLFKFPSWYIESVPEIPGALSLDYSPNGEYIVATDAVDYGGIKIFRSDDYTEIASVALRNTTAVSFSNDGKYLFVTTRNTSGVLVLDTSDWAEIPDIFSISDGATDVHLSRTTGDLYVATSIAAEQPLACFKPESDSASLQVGSTEGGSDYAQPTVVDTENGVGGRFASGSLVPKHGVSQLYGSAAVKGDHGMEVRFVVRGYFIEV